MTTTPVTSGTATSAAASTATTAKNPYSNLGMADFLKLLTTQMKDQDPTQPVDNTQMIAQMAQFSSLTGINDMSATLKSIATKLDAITAAQQATQTTAAA